MTSDELGPKTKVGESKPAEPLEATPASHEDGIHVKRVPAIIGYGRVVRLYSREACTNLSCNSGTLSYGCVPITSLSYEMLCNHEL